MNILIVSPWLPHKDVGHAGGQHLYHTVRTLVERGQHVHVLCYGRGEQPDQVASCAALCNSLTIVTPAYTWRQKLVHVWQEGRWRPWLIGRRTHHQVRDHLRLLCRDRQIDVVQLAWTEMGRYLDAVPDGTGAVLGTMDVEYVVRSREVALLPPGVARFQAQRRATQLRCLERRAVGAAHVILACSAYDRAALLRLHPAAPVMIVPPWIGLADPAAFDPDPVVPGRLVFMGALDRLANQAAARWLLNDVWPQLRRSAPHATLRLVGVNPPAALRALAAADSRVTVTGYVPDLSAEWRAADVAVCPSLVGGGLLIKVAQPLWLGRPVVTTTRGNEGTAAPVGTAIDVADDSGTFATTTLRLLHNRAHWQQRARSGQSYAHSAFDWQRSMDRLESAYEQAVYLARAP